MLARLLTTGLGVLLLLPALVRADNPPKGDKDLDGDWILTVLVVDGKEAKTPPEAKFGLIAQGNTATFKSSGGMNTTKIKLDLTQTPKAIDITGAEADGKEMTVLGIYEVKDDGLRICFAGPGKDRPTELASKEGSGWNLATYKRVKK